MTRHKVRMVTRPLDWGVLQHWLDRKIPLAGQRLRALECVGGHGRIPERAVQRQRRPRDPVVDASKRIEVAEDGRGRVIR